MWLACQCLGESIVEYICYLILWHHWPNSGPFLLFENLVIVCVSTVPRIGSKGLAHGREKEKKNGEEGEKEREWWWSGDKDSKKKKKSDHLLCTRCYAKTCAYVSVGYSTPNICHQDKYGFKVSIIVGSYFIPFNSPTKMLRHVTNSTGASSKAQHYSI